MVLADDHDAYRRGLARVLRDDPRFELVAEVSDGPAAVNAAHEHRPGLVIIDVRMPGIDGFAACERLAGLRHTRVVLITDEPTDSLRSRAAEVGAAALVDKSAPRGEICNRLKEIAD